MNRRLFLFCLWLLWQQGAAQPPSLYTFSHYSMSNGLISNEIRSIVQDRTGYLWIASNNGLQRYDGVHFKTFQHKDGNPHSLPINSILQLLLDKDDNLWVLTTNGQTGIFDKQKFTFTAVPAFPRQRMSLWAQKFLLTDEQGNLFYLLHEHEVLALDKHKMEFSPEANFIPIRPEWKVSGMAQQPGTSKYWLSLQSGGVAIYNRQTGRMSYPGHNAEKEPAIDSLKKFHQLAHLYFDRKGRFWSVSWDSVVYPHAVCFATKRPATPVRTFEFLSTLKSYNEIHGFMEQQDGRLWLRGSPVLAVFDEANKKFNLLPSDSRNGLGIVYDLTSALFEDREMNVWVATANNGLYRCNPSQEFFISVPHLNQRTKKPGRGSIMSFVELKNGDILAGSWGDGIFRYNKDFREVPLQIRDDVNQNWASIWSMTASADSNTIWMSCQPGIYQYDQAKGVMHYRNPPALKNRTVRQIAEDRQGNLWLGLQSFGLFKWRSPKEGKNDSLLFIPAAGRDAVTQVLADKEGLIWVTTEKKGIFAFESETAKIRYHWNNRPANDSVSILDGFTGVLPYNDSTVVFSTATRLYQLNRRTGTVRLLSLPASLLGRICILQKDEKNYLWIGTENGLYRFHLQTGTLLFFNRSDGIANDHFIDAAAYRLKSGRMLLGTDNAFIHFLPSDLNFTNQDQRVILTSLQVGRHDLPVDSVMQRGILKLPAGDHSLTVDFSSLSYVSTSPIQYKLDGIDKEWHKADKDNRASFPFLPPGRFTLLLRMANADGTQSGTTALKIEIQAPFYQTWWFYALLAIVAATFLIWLDRQRMKRKAALQKVRTDIAGGLHQEVNTALNNINILSEIARLKSDREPQKAKDYLEQIHTKSHNMIVALDDMLWSLDPENDAMDKTIARIREYADSLTQRSGAVIELLIDKKVERLQLHMKVRHEAFLLFKEGLRSLIEAGTGSCIVHLTAERGKLLFTIEFENEHCNMQKLNNLLQRHDMEDRLHELKAKLHVQVHKSRSVFLLQLPL